MRDLQNEEKDFLFEVDVVGVENIKVPMQIDSLLQPKIQSTIVTFTLGARLSQFAKGTNMSRFVVALEKYRLDNQLLSIPSLRKLAVDLTEELEQNEIKIHVSFPWFYERKAPISTFSAMNHSQVDISLNYHQKEGFSHEVSLTSSVTTLCPCSKEISEYSAHNQRGEVKITAHISEVLDENIDWKVSLLNAIESNASSKLFPILKRPDEKIVTETAYENPRFVEDLARLVAADLCEYDWISSFTVKCKNQESIHLHDAVATIHYNRS